MIKAAVWLFCTYLTLKLIQFFFGDRPGFRKIPLSLREKLLRGEPLLFAIAFAISVPAALWSSRFLHQGYTRAFEHATDCYGKLRAVDALADVGKRVDAYQVYKAVLGAQGAAFLAAQSLKLEPAVVNKALTDKMDFYARRYANLSRQGGRREIRDQTGAIERCLNEPSIEL